MDITKNRDVNGKTYNRLLLIISVLVGGFMAVLTETLLNNGLPAISQSLHVNMATVQWLSTGYLLTIGIMMPISALLLYKFNSKKLYLSSLIIFLLGSVISYIAPNFSLLLTGRIIQAVSVGIIMPFMQNIIVMIFPIEKRGMAMGLAGVVIALAPAIGPTLSGWIVDNYSWRDLFGLLIPISIMVILLAVVGMRKIIVTTNPKIDSLSIIYSTVGFGGLLYGFSTLSSGSLIVSILALVIGVIGVWLLVRRQLRMQTPMLDMHVFRSKTFTLTTWLSSLSNMSFIGMQLLVPLYLQSVFQVSALTAGLVMLPGALMMGVMNPIAGRLFDRYGIRVLAIIGFSIFTITTILFVIINQNTPLVLVTILYAIWMGGISLIVMQLGTAGINDLKESLIAHGNAVNAMARQVAAAIATALLISISVLGTKFSHSSSLIVTQLTGYRTAFLAVAVISVVGLYGVFKLKKQKN
ncbi:MDR family MFS transporter [Pediococcus siamensis]|uniref:MDR family MFS transporter n=1 Tax=Pediococcus siamensis TaxID=381829 RepID=UPI00399F734D